MTPCLDRMQWPPSEKLHFARKGNTITDLLTWGGDQRLIPFVLFSHDVSFWLEPRRKRLIIEISGLLQSINKHSSTPIAVSYWDIFSLSYWIWYSIENFIAIAIVWTDARHPNVGCLLYKCGKCIQLRKLNFWRTNWTLQITLSNGFSWGWLPHLYFNQRRITQLAGSRERGGKGGVPWGSDPWENITKSWYSQKNCFRIGTAIGKPQILNSRVYPFSNEACRTLPNVQSFIPQLWHFCGI